MNINPKLRVVGDSDSVAVVVTLILHTDLSLGCLLSMQIINDKNAYPVRKKAR